MSSPMFDELEAALEELRSQQKRIREAQQEAEQETTSFRTKDRMISAVVDHKLRLTELKLSGTRYRNLAPAELAGRIVEAVQAAQDEAAKKSMDVFTQLAPTASGSQFGEVLNTEFDLDRMFEEAVRIAQTPIFPEDTKQSEKNKEAEPDGK
ncbi:YbaB/EbfC family nucleoid-associated protein [Saccharopolyspora hattusasensis]|uniref:YbaB/EbfC family nucleoid-associated protein n=1 Tax=Saccharopolyspora hattusasensis TaxID=1128679 RepID=UPI003D965943